MAVAHEEAAATDLANGQDGEQEGVSHPWMINQTNHNIMLASGAFLRSVLARWWCLSVTSQNWSSMV